MSSNSKGHHRLFDGDQIPGNRDFRLSKSISRESAGSTTVGTRDRIWGENWDLSEVICSAFVTDFRRPDLPNLFGGTQFTTRTLRFAWHITSIAWWGFAGILVLLARPPVSFHAVALVVGVTFLVTSAIVLVGSRGKHLAWPVFLIVAIVALHAAST
jgi:hypothetical protein